MPDNQEEKIKFLIKKAGFGIDEAIKKLGISKQTFYNNVRKEPINKGFKLKMKELLDIELEKSLINEGDISPKDAEIKRLRDELEEVRRELKEERKEKDKAKNEYIELLKKKNK